MISDDITEWRRDTSHIETEISDLTIEKAKLAERAKSIKKRIDCLAEYLQELRTNGPQSTKRKMASPAGEPIAAVCSVDDL